MNWQSIKNRLIKSEDMICDECNGTGKLKTKPLWIDLSLIGAILILMGLLVLILYVMYLNASV